MLLEFLNSPIIAALVLTNTCPIFIIEFIILTVMLYCPEMTGPKIWK